MFYYLFSSLCENKNFEFMLNTKSLNKENEFSLKGDQRSGAIVVQ